MNRAALVLTGGTIGSSEHDSALRAEEGTEHLLLRKYKEKGGSTSFDIVRAETMLSENFSEDAMLKIARDVASLDGKGYCATVVATGTDNLGYFSVLLAFLLSAAKMPIFVISSQFVLTDERENGSDNLLALDSALRRISRGVYVLNRNLGEKFVSVHAAVRMNQCLAPTGDFTSASGLVGKVEKGKFRRCEPVFSEILAFYEEKRKIESDDVSEIPTKLGNVAVYSVSPFSVPTLPSFPPDAVFLNLYHSGTAAVKGKSSVIPFLKECGKLGIPVFAAPAFFGSIPYETTVKLAENGVRFLLNTPPLAAELKVRVMYSSGNKPKVEEKFFRGNAAGEVLGNGNGTASTKI